MPPFPSEDTETKQLRLVLSEVEGQREQSCNMECGSAYIQAHLTRFLTTSRSQRVRIPGRPRCARKLRKVEGIKGVRE